MTREERCVRPRKGEIQSYVDVLTGFCSYKRVYRSHISNVSSLNCNHEDDTLHIQHECKGVDRIITRNFVKINTKVKLGPGFVLRNKRKTTVQRQLIEVSLFRGR